jgi:hypothetical protein
MHIAILLKIHTTSHELFTILIILYLSFPLILTQPLKGYILVTISVCLCLSLFHFLGGTVTWTQGLHLVRRHFTAWCMLLVLFALVILETKSHFLPRPIWTMILLFYTSSPCWDDRHVPPCPVFFHWDGNLPNFLPGLALNHDPSDLCLPSSSN